MFVLFSVCWEMDRYKNKMMAFWVFSGLVGSRGKGGTKKGV